MSNPKNVFLLADQTPEKTTVQKTLLPCEKTSFREIDFLSRTALIRESPPDTPKYSDGSGGRGGEGGGP